MERKPSWFKVDPKDTGLFGLLTLDALTYWENRHFPPRAYDSPQVLVLDKPGQGLDPGLVNLARFTLNGYYVDFASQVLYPHASLHEHIGDRAGQSALVVVIPNLNIPQPLDPLVVIGLAITDLNFYLEQAGIGLRFPPLPPIGEIPQFT